MYYPTLLGTGGLIALVISVFIIGVTLSRLCRISDATEVTAQSLKSINRKINAIMEQVVPKDVQQTANAEYDSKSQPTPQRMR